MGGNLGKGLMEFTVLHALHAWLGAEGAAGCLCCQDGEGRGQVVHMTGKGT